MKIRAITGLFLGLLFLNPVAAQIQRPGISVIPRTGNYIIRRKMNGEQKKRLLPNPLDLKKYESFLEAPRTGIFRLMPDLGCTENVNVLKVDAVCLQYIPESSFYSFREKEHTFEMLADLRLEKNYLITDGLMTQGIMVHLGEIELEKITTATEGMAFLSNFSPNPLSSEAQKQYFQLLRGVKIGDYEYKKAAPLVENGTYALRVVAYRGSIFRSFRGYRFDLLEGDKRVDLLLAFRVIRKDTDGSVTLLWKEIERKESPCLVFPKRKKK